MQPNADARELDEGEVVGREFVVSSRDAPALLDLIGESLDPVPRSVKVGAKTDWLLAIAFWRNVGPGTLLADECPDPISIIPSVC